MIDQFVRLHNEGVSELLAGNDKLAELLLQNSLTALKQVTLLSSSSSGISTSSTQLNQNQTQSKHGWDVLSQTLKNECPTSCKRKLGLIDTFHPLPILQKRSEAFLYSNVVTLQCWNHNNEEESTTSLNEVIRLYTACVVFNLALVYHSRTNLNGNDTTTNYKRAERLYDTIQQLIPICVCNSGPSTMNMTIALILKIAAANNVSFLRYEQGNYDQARGDLKVVAILIQSVTQDINSSMLLAEEEIDGLRMNFVFLLTNAISAPAA